MMMMMPPPESGDGLHPRTPRQGVQDLLQVLVHGDSPPRGPGPRLPAGRVRGDHVVQEAARAEHDQGQRTIVKFSQSRRRPGTIVCIMSPALPPLQQPGPGQHRRPERAPHPRHQPRLPAHQRHVSRVSRVTCPHLESSMWQVEVPVTSPSLPTPHPASAPASMPRAPAWASIRLER